MLKKIFRTSVFCLLAVTILSNAVSAQKRPVKANPQNSKKTEVPVSETSNPAMSAVWQSGELPAPLAISTANQDEAAVILAQKVSAKTEESIPALLTALQLAGFFVTKKDGSVFLAPPDNKGQGLTINGWEAAGAAKMFGDGKTTTLKDLNERLRSISAMKTVEPATLMMQGVRANAENADNQFLRFWARFILELGKENAASLKAANSEGGEIVNAIQHLLLFRRLYGDLFARQSRYLMQANGFAAAEELYEKRRFPRFVGASASTAEEIFLSVETENIVSANSGQSQIPCRMDGNAPTVMDASATVIGYGYGELMGYLENVFEDTPTGTALEKAGKVQAVANIILAYAKFVQTYAALEVKLVLDDAPPLVRTKNAAPGERKNLHSEVRMNIGNWQMYNCIRTALNVTAGIDFATLNDGPLGDVGVTWHLDKGGAGDFYSNGTGINRGGEQIVGFTQNGVRIQDKGATVGTKGSAIGNAVYGKTDNKGITQIMLEGSPQKNAKTFKAKPVMKEAIVRTTIKLKAGEIKGDMVDVAGQAINGVGGLITMPTELLYRISWASSGTLTVPVKDWEDCAGGWTGTITATTKYRKEQSDLSSGRLIEAITIKERTEKIVYNVTGERDDSSGLVNGYFADAALTYQESSFAKNIYQGSIDCRARRFPNMNETQTFEQKASANADARVTVYISVAGKNGSLLSSNSIQAVGEKWFSQTYKTACAANDITNTKAWYKDNYPFEHGGQSLSIDIEADPKNPDVLNGSKTVKNSDGSETNYEWNLSLCR